MLRAQKAMERVGGQGGSAANAAAPPLHAQAPTLIEREERKEESDEAVDEVMGVAVASSSEQRVESGELEDEEDEYEEEEVLVVLELCDFKNHPVFDDYESLALQGIESASPTLRIGDFSLHGQLEETVGTSFFYDTTQRGPGGEYLYAGQTVRKIKFTIEPPEPSPLQSA